MRTRSQGLVLRVVAACTLAIVGCGGDDDGGDSCGSPESPLVFTVEDVTPASGSTVANEEIVHRFKLIGNDALSQLNGTFGAGHSAGLPATPLTWSATLQSDGVIYEAEPMSWPNAPAEVRLDLTGVYQTSGHCFYELPKPMFSYSVTAPE